MYQLEIWNAPEPRMEWHRDWEDAQKALYGDYCKKHGCHFQATSLYTPNNPEICGTGTIKFFNRITGDTEILESVWLIPPNG